MGRRCSIHRATLLRILSWPLPAARFGAWCVVALSLLLLAAAPAVAGVGEWTTGGPFIRDVWDIAVHPGNPGILYVGALGGLLRSVDGGATWVRAEEIDGPVQVVAVDPGQPSTVYGVQWSTMWKSDDGGESWRSLAAAPILIADVAVAPWDSMVVYAVTESSLGPPDNLPGRVWMSTDGAETWQDVSAGTDLSGHLAVAFDADAPGTVYVVTRSNVYRRRDGSPWAKITPVEGLGLGYSSIAVRPRAPGELYVGTTFGGAFQSIDGGDSWALLGGAPLEVQDLAIDADGPVVYAASNEGIFRSLDEGATWTLARSEAGSIRVRSVAVDPGVPATVWAGARGDGLLHSMDRGEQWTIVEAGRPFGAQIASLAVAPGSRPVLYAGTEASGVFASLDGGATWDRRNRGLDEAGVTSLAVAPSDPQFVFAFAATALALETRAGFFCSTDGGESWTDLGWPLSAVPLFITVDPTLPRRLWVGTGSGIYASTNGGGTWHRVDSLCQGVCPVVYDLEVDPRQPSVLHVATSVGLFRSVDGGRQWTPLGTGLPSPLIYTLEIDPLQPSTFYAGTPEGVFRSTDFGVTWAAANSGQCETLCPSISQILIRSSSILYALSITGDKLLVSRDGATTWDRMAPPVPQGIRARALVMHPWSPSTLYAGWTAEALLGSGVYDLLEADCDAPDTVCFGDGRFLAEVGWRDFDHRRAVGRTTDLASAQSAVFWFFGEQNWELLVKVIDGTPFNHHVWVFAGAASNVEYGLRITDLPAGRSRLYHNALGQSAVSVAQIEAFPADPGPVVQGPVAEEVVEMSPAPSFPRAVGFDPSVVGEPCIESPGSLCLLDGRFRLNASFRDFAGRHGAAQAVPTSADDSGLFWFFGAENWELLVKMVDACLYNDHFWVFATATTNVEFELLVTDLLTGAQTSYHNPLGQAAAAVTDTGAFSTCP